MRAAFSLSYITRLESGDAEPGLELVVRIAHALGVSVHDLILETPSDPWLSMEAQARRRLNAILERHDREALAVVLPVLALAEEASSRRRK
ncbi:MAG: helix-turn-helix transcriptional regulator [Planctomycetes bacterium]|nr:helix-turn-helix transcriptional regulator [Planctomycetota bacterium]